MRIINPGQILARKELQFIVLWVSIGSKEARLARCHRVYSHNNRVYSHNR